MTKPGGLLFPRLNLSKNTKQEIINHLKKQIIMTSNCWFWIGRVTNYPNGSSRRIVLTDQKDKSAYRVMYEVVVGKIKKGNVIDHLCNNPICVNPAHLKSVSSWMNTYRSNCGPAINAKKDHCVNGHLLAKDNLLNTTRNTRVCRECNRIRCAKQLEKRQKKKGTFGLPIIYRPRQGERHPFAKLTEKDVLQIHADYIPFEMTTVQLAKKYGVTKTTIHKIIQGRNWKEVYRKVKLGGGLL